MAHSNVGSFEFGGVTFGTAVRGDAQQVGPQTPFRILLLGDFSGRAARVAARETTPLASRTPRRIGRDNFAEVLGKFEVRLPLPISTSDGHPHELRFAALDDFEPDNLLESVPPLASLADLRRRLLSNSTFDAAAAEVSRMAGDDVAPAMPPPLLASKDSSFAEPRQADLKDLLDQAVHATEKTHAEELAAGTIDVQQLAKRIVAPYVLDKPHPKQAELIACVDEMTSELLRSVLHDRGFQALEAAWRGVHILLKRLETDPSLQVYLLDVTKQEIAADVNAADELGRTSLYKLIVEQTVSTPGAVPWAVLVGDYEFDVTAQDAQLAGRLANIAAGAGAPFLAGASSRHYECESLATSPNPDDWQFAVDEGAAAAWQGVRNLDAASYFGLAAPRFLLRKPFGKESAPIDAFDFEENPDASHDHYLWGNGALAVACMLGTEFTHNGWGMRCVVGEVDGLSLHFVERNDEMYVQQCGEVLLNERAIKKILAANITPLVPQKDQDRLVAMSIMSQAGPLLSGRWSHGQ